MSFKYLLSSKILLAFVVLGGVAFLATDAFAQQSAAASSNAGNNRTGAPEDWTHRHLIFSNPGSYEEAVKNGKVAEWYRIVGDPRYQFQQAKQKQGQPQQPTAENSATPAEDSAVTTSAESVEEDASAQILKSNARVTKKKKKPAADWSYFLGSTSGAGVSADASPAKYTWNLNGSPSCSDYAAFAMNKAGLSNQPSIAAFTNLYVGPAVSASSLGVVTANNVASGNTVAVNATTLTASAPVSQVSTISVPSSSYCVAPGAGVTVNGTNVTTNATAPTGGSVQVTANGFSGTTAVGGVVYTWETSLGTSGCGTTLNCVLVSASGSGSQGHDNTAEALYRAINNTGTSTCSNTGATNPCYALAAGQGVNAEATASYPANTDTVTIGTWKCAGAAANFGLTDTGSPSVTLTQPSGGSVGTTSGTNFALPTPNSNATLSSNINTAIGNSGATGFTKIYTSPTITLTASTPGSTGFTLALDGTSTGITLATTTAGSNGTTTPGSTFAYWSGSAAASTTQLASNLATAIGGVSGVSATAGSNTVTVSATTAGTTGNSIALGTPTFTGFTWASSTLLGGSAAGQCGSGAPSVSWAYYNTAATTASTPVLTSPVLSYDGSKVAFVEQGTASGAILRLIKWVAGGNGTMGAPVVPGNTATNWTACGTAGNGACQITLTYNSAHATTNTKSAPFYDYNSDSLYIGSDNGYLYKISPVFNGGATAPAVVANWPVLVDSGAELGSPVYDPASTHVFVADSLGKVSYVTTGATPASTTVITGLTNPDDPIVDSTNGKVYLFTGSNGSNAAVLQATTTLGSATTETIGTLSTSTNVYDGMFDNNFFNTGTGYLYACGNPGGPAATLYRIPITSGAMSSGTAAQGPALSTAAAGCSPMNEIFNTSTDWLMLGLTANCGYGGSTTGCANSVNITGWQKSTGYALNQIVLDSNFNIQKATSAGTSGGSTPSWSATQNGITSDGSVSWVNLGQIIPSATLAEAGGTSAMVVDNVGTNGHNSNLYFANLTGGQTCGTGSGTACAVNVTQAGLH